MEALMIARIARLGAIWAGVLAMTGTASAMDFTFTPRVSLGMEKYSLKFIGYGSDGKEFGNLIDVDGYTPTLTIGGTVATGSLYLDAYVQQTGSVRDSNDFYRLDRNPPERWDENSKIDHRDYALSLGYSFENGATIFGGYKNGKASINNREQGTQITSSGFFNQYTNYWLNDASFQADGPFLGAGYGWHLGPGILSITGAWAWLDGKVTQTQQSFSARTGQLLYLRHYVSKPSTSGLALSLGWKAPITEQLSYGISLDAYRYDFDKKDERGYLIDYTNGGAQSDAGTIPLKVKEQSVGIRASLAYHF
jgi:hypothetical protein